MITTGGIYPWSSVTQIFRSDLLKHDSERKIFRVMTST